MVGENGQSASLGADEESGARFGEYSTRRVLGRGGMGVVFEAVHVASGRKVALKAMSHSLRGDDTAVQRFVREAQLARQLAHPNIMRVLDSGVEAGRPYLVMELLEGETLRAFLQREGSLPLSVAIGLVLPVLSATATIHDAGVVHRDLKSANVFLIRRGDHLEPVVLDFGLSRLGLEASLASDSTLTSTGGLLGTPHYFAPEQVLNGKAASARSDQYAVALLLYECVTGRRPFSGSSPYEIMHAILTQPAPAPSAHVPALPEGFDEVLARAMHREPQERYADVREFAKAILRFSAAADYARWAREFERRAPAEPSEQTERDLRSSFASVVPPSAPIPAGSRRGRREHAARVGAVAAVVALATALSASSRSRLELRPEHAPSTSSSARAPAPSRTLEPLHAPIPLGSNAIVLTAMTALPPVPSASSAPRRKAPTTRRQTTTLRAPPVLSASSAAPHRAPLGEDDAIDPFGN